MNLPKSLIRSLYDLQHERIQTGNRICAEIKARLGQRPSQSEADLEKESKTYLENARKEYKRIADAFVLNKAHTYLKINFENYHIISNPAMLLFIEIYIKQLEYEDKMVKVVKKLVEQHPMWDAFLVNVKGCGPLMSAVILTEFDIRKERISMFWKYAGLDVAEDGRGRGRYKEHLVDTDYIDKNGDKKTKKGITFNPFLKTKLTGVLASSFLKQIEWIATTKKVYDVTSEDRRKIKKDTKTKKDIYCIIGQEGAYRVIYNNYKHRLENHVKYGIQNDEKRIAEAKANKNKYAPKAHRHNMAMRYMIKMFIQDLWLAWRALENLPITKPYAEAVLEHKHHSKGEKAA